MTEDIGYKEAKSGDVIKFEKEGDSIEGIYQGHEESKKYPESFAVHIKQGDDIKTVFTSNILIDLLGKNGIKEGKQIKIVYDGKKKTEDGSKEYNCYRLFYKE